MFDVLKALFPGQPIRRDADFFSDLGGHSLFAARLASALRALPGYAHVTVRDIYQHRKIAAIAVAIASSQTAAQPAAARPRAVQRISAWRRWRCGAAQAVMVERELHGERDEAHERQEFATTRRHPPDARPPGRASL